MEKNKKKLDKFEQGEYMVYSSKVYGLGLLGRVFPPRVPGTYHDLELFGVFRISPHNDVEDWGIDFKLRFNPIGKYENIMSFRDYYTSDIYDLVIDCDEFKGYNYFYHFTNADDAENFAREQNEKIFVSLTSRHYVSNDFDLAYNVGRKMYFDLCNLVSGVGFDDAMEKLCGFNNSFISKDGKKYFDCQFDYITARVFKTEEGFCSVSKLIEVWNFMRTISVSVLLN